MAPRNFPEYGPIQRRRAAPEHTRRTRPMATPNFDQPYTEATVPIRTLPRRVAALPRPYEPPRRGRGWWWKAPLVLLLLLATGAVAGLAWLDNQYRDRILPNVALQGIDLSRNTMPEAQRKIEVAFGTFLTEPITLTYQERAWHPLPADLGVRIDVQRSLNEAYRFGRSNGLVTNLSQVAQIYQQGRDLPLRITVDERKLGAFLQSIAAEVEQPGREAALAIVQGSPQSTESINGRMVLLDETRTDIQNALRTLKPQSVSLRTTELRPQLTTDGIAEAKRTVEAMLQSPIELVFGETVFPLDQAELADMIVLQRVDGGDGNLLNAQLDQGKLLKFATLLADEIGRDSVEPRVNFNGGALEIFREGRVGIPAQHRPHHGAGQRRGDNRNPAPGPAGRRSAAQGNARESGEPGVRELVSIGRSDYSGSAAYRIHNIKAGVNLMHGILIPPEGEFSFNENVGAIDEEHGFVEGYAIVGNRTQLEPGGGICQDSTTLFRAAFYAGLPFTDWTPHRFRISWYEKYEPIGMDSTIFTGGGPDLRFVNDTGNWLLIQGYANDADASVTFSMYGTKVPGRVVERTEPVITNETPAPPEPLYIDDPEQPVGSFKQTDTARGGMEIEIWRVIRQNGEEVSREPFRTKFEAWPDIFLKHPKTPKPRG